MNQKEPPKKCEESILSVIVDIFLEALGLREIEDVIIRVVENNPEVQEKIDELAKALKLSDWEQAIDLVVAIMNLLSDAGMADLFIKALGKKEGRRAWRRLLTKLGARFVPFVGQVYTAISIALALFNNRQRLLHAIRGRFFSRTALGHPIKLSRQPIWRGAEDHAKQATGLSPENTIYFRCSPTGWL